MDDLTQLEFPRSGATTMPLLFEPQLLRCRAAGPGGTPLYVLLDTGTDPSAMDARLARRLALPSGGSGVGHGMASDTVPFTEVVLPWLRLGDLTIRNLFAPSLDLSFLPFPIDIVLGYNVLRQLVLHIDYKHAQLTLAHPELGFGPAMAAGATLPLTFFEHLPAVRDLVVEGTLIALATIDTGSNGALSLGPDLARAFGLVGEASALEQGYGAGFGGTSAILSRTCRELRLGPFTLADVQLDAHGLAVGDLGRPGRANIGNALLSRFARVTLDYERGMAEFEP